MSIVRPFDNQTAATLSLAVPAIDVAQNYALLDVSSSTPGETAINNVASVPSLPEVVSFKYQKLKSISTNKEMKQLYPSIAKDGFQFVVKDEYFERITDADGTVHDEPVVAYFVLRTTRGSSIQDGSNVDTVIRRLYGTAVMQGASTDSPTDTMFDRLLHGATVPVAIR